MFTHLHVHSHFSLLDGLPKIGDLVRRAKQMGMTSLALTDHGAMHGAIEFYNACRSEGLNPILGFEAYMAPDDLRGRGGRESERPYHLTLLAKNFAGYRNLMKLTTIAHLEGFYYKPRIDFATLEAHREGVVVLSGCVNSEVAKNILAGSLPAARETIERFRSVFQEDYYLEIQRQEVHGDSRYAEQREAVNTGLLKLSEELGVPLVATADSHYLLPEDAEAQDILVCVETGRTVGDANRLDMRGIDLSLQSEDSMRSIFADLPGAIEATNEIAAKIDIRIPLRQWAFPVFDIPQGHTADSYLRHLAYEGLAHEYRTALSDLPRAQPQAVERLEYELDIIARKEYSSYFLVVSDFAIWARKEGIVTTTRGSAAGSLVAFSLGITAINPLDYQLPFERFLNLERPLPPDIDTDFADNRRDEVIAYVTRKYGTDKVAQIVTFGTMLARAAVRDVGRVLGVPYGKCDKIAKLIPFGRQGFHMTIDDALRLSPELAAAYDTDEETRRILQLSRKVEGVARHASIHAAGVVISPLPLTEYTPLRMDTDTKIITTQYDMHSVEETGLVKMDFLGIRNLSILGAAVTIVSKTKGVSVDINHLPLDDKKTFHLLSEGRTTGLFQLGGSGMTKYLKELKPTKVEDIMAMVALFRPGPMESIPEFIRRKHDPTLISYLDDRLAEILSASYGVITYQDDVLLIAIKIAGYTWQEADKLRKAMGKKIPHEMAEQKEKFIEGCSKSGLTSAKALKLWKLIEPFAAYGFNKAHAASYGMVAYQTAYMKANFPVEYMAAVMTAESGNIETIAEAVGECKAMGITVLPPEVNESLDGFTVIDEKTIRFGLGGVKNLGSDVIGKIIEERKTHGKYTNLSDFISRTLVRNFNKKSWEALVKCGALDAFGERNQLLENTDMILSLTRSFVREIDTAQNSLFGASGPRKLMLKLEPARPANERDMLAWEKELLGLYITAHPLDEYRDTLNKFTSILSLKSSNEEQSVIIGGLITQIKTIITKKGEQMCFAALEDLTGSAELVVFPRVFADSRDLLAPDAMVKVWGKFHNEEGDAKILVDRLSRLTALQPQVAASRPKGPHFVVTVPKNADPLVFRKLKTVFERYPGNVRVLLSVFSPHGAAKPIETDFRITDNDQLKHEVAQILKQ